MGLGRLYFATRLTWRQLVHEKGKLIAAILGVMFAAILVFMQLGFRDSLYASISKLPRALDGDLFIQHHQTEAIWRNVPFERAEMMRAYASPDVASVTPFYIGMAPWRNPQTFNKRTLVVYGYAPETRLLTIPGVSNYQDILTTKDNLIFDRLSRPEFGTVGHPTIENPVDVEVSDTNMHVVGTFALGPSFATDGVVITSDQNFMRLFPGRNLDQVNIGVIRLKPGANVAHVQAQLKGLLNNTVNVFNKDEVVDYEFQYWSHQAPIGFIFGFGVMMGLVVGMVIVYQILYTDITNHLKEFATLKAMGYTHGYLLRVVFSESLILAIIGFVPGLGLSYMLYKYAESVIFIQMPMPIEKIVTVFVMIVIMCMTSGIIAMRKLKYANPAEMF